MAEKVRLVSFSSKGYDIASFAPYLKKEKLTCKFYEVSLSIDTVKLAKGYDAVIVFVNDILDKQVISKLHAYHIKAIFLRCAGYNNVDLKVCHQYQIPVFRVPAYSPYAVSEHTFALLATLNRRTHKAYNRVKEYNFSLNDFVGMDLFNKTIGVIGTGKIGECLINIAKGYGMHVLAYDKYPKDIKDVSYVSLEELFKRSDVISLHCPLNEETYHIVNKESIALMKKGVIILNTSRGALIDAKALLNGINSRKIGAAGLDVYEEEANLFYLDKSNHILEDKILLQLIAMPNVLITSHQAYLTKEALDNIASVTTNNIVNFFFNKEVTTINQVCDYCESKGNCNYGKTCQNQKKVL